MVFPHERDEARIDQGFDWRIHRKMQVPPDARHHLPVEKRLLDDELGQPVQCRLRRTRQEGLRAKKAVDRMIDPRQSLRPDDTIAQQVDLRLICHVEPVRFERLGEVDLNRVVRGGCLRRRQRGRLRGRLGGWLARVVVVAPEDAPQVLGALVRRFGHLDIADDADQDALLAAAQHLPAHGVHH